MLPKDIAMLVSILNTKLRDDDMSLETIVEVYDEDYQVIMNKLELNNYEYDHKQKQIKKKS
ncbi:DUF4250 domain-containing protein [Tannockella kyphosi]|uniref:DUF4250 domain-containing protein n=1 Tax=Tannockella kyphosi TaxID=2899121 RepID=UPI002011C83A|nr:DUF4250 domain-containing protein [Tannockella kyphosi]